MENKKILKSLKINYDFKCNIIEEEVYKILCKNNLKREEIIDENILQITESTINEFIKTDIEVRNCNDVWVTKNLDSFYTINLKNIKLSEDETKQILPKTKNNNIRKLIINANIIITCLLRLDGIILYNKLKKKEYPNELSEKIKFTKGYLVCFSPELVNKLKNYQYLRKKINKKPINIQYLKKECKVKDILNNNNFSTPIWIKENEINKIKIESIKFNKNILNDDFNPEKVLDTLNFLNKINIMYDDILLEKIDKIANYEKILDKNIISKNSLKNNIYQINNEENETIITDEYVVEKNLQGLINNTATYELIKKQLKEYKGKEFFLNYLYDSRGRIYCENWPINYQLNHIIRNIIILKKEHSIEDIYKSFTEDSLIKKYIKNYKILLIDYIGENKILEDFIKKECLWGNSENNKEKRIKKELLVIFLRKLSEKVENNLNKSIELSIKLFKEFTEDDLEINIEYWINKTKIKKIPLLINIQQTLKNIKKDIFQDTFWGDASSNAIQLITLRLGNLNNKLLMLTNIVENKTKYKNIYSYVTAKIKKMNNESILKEIKNKISNKELIELQNDEDNKYRIMPASYGMGEHKNLKNMEIRLMDRKEIWEKLNKKDKIKVSKYFWEKTFEILEKEGFSMNKYKNLFKNFKEYDACMWYNDYGIPIIPIKTIKSKRQQILKNINENKIKLKENKNIKIEENIKKLKEKREIDDKTFWKRTMIKTKIKNENYEIYIRIPNTSNKLNKKEMLQSIIPNSIHSYDSSVICLVIEICKKLGIKVLVIHDSVGCNIIYAPIVKTIFKIANIIILENNTKKKPFPFDNINIEKEYKLDNIKKINKLKKRIIESTNFFK